MARDFLAASTRYLSNNTAVRSATPVSLGCWFYMSSATNGTVLSMSDEAADNNYFALTYVAGTALRAQSRASGNYAEVDTTSTPGTSTWYHGLAVYTSQSSRAVYLDGGNKDTDSTDISGDPVGMDNTIIAALKRSTTINYLDGYVAEAAIWGAALTDAEAVMLAAGYSPLLIRPQSLVAYWPLIGRTSPEIDIVGSYDMTLNNAPTTSEHPPVNYAPNKNYSYKTTPPTDVSGQLLLTLSPTMYTPDTSNYATLAVRNRRPMLEFDQGTQETAFFDGTLPQKYTDNGISVNVYYTTAGTSGTVIWDAQFEKIADMDDDSFDSAQSIYSNVPSISGRLKVAKIRFTNSEIDGLSGGDAFRLKIARDATADNLLQDAQIHWVELRET